MGIPAGVRYGMPNQIPNMDNDTPPPPPPEPTIASTAATGGGSPPDGGKVGKKGMSTGAKWGIGCGSGCLVLIILGAILLLGGWSWVKGKIDEEAQPFRDQGFAEQTGQMIRVTEAPADNSLYVGQMVLINTDTDKEIAIIAQMAEVKGTHTSKIYFRGQMIKIHEGASLEGGLDVKCQVIDGTNKVPGGVTGTYSAESQIPSQIPAAP